MPNYWQLRQSFILRDSNWNCFQVGYPVATSHFAATPQWCSVHMCKWFSASWQRFRYDRKCLFSCIYNLQITISPTLLFSANFNRNHVKNHPKPWTCPLTLESKKQISLWHVFIYSSGQVSAMQITLGREKKTKEKKCVSYFVHVCISKKTF